MTKKEALQAIDREREVISQVSDRIWDHPETAFQEYVAAETYFDALEKEGFAVEKNLAGIETAFSGRFGHGRPVIGILGEFDALSGLSQKPDCAVKAAIAEGAPGHGCGHNLLGAGSMAAAIAVKEYLEKNNKEGTVIFYGCPGEEGGSGKGFMARDGVFDELDCAVSWHPGDMNVASVGSSLANYQIYYRFYGRASHAAGAPHLGRSALDAVELMNVGVQFLREHVISEARIHYAITNTGGFSPNVVQPFSEVLYLIRAPKTPQVQEIYERINDIARGAALMTGTKMEMQFVKACSNLVSNTTLSKVLQKNLETTERVPYTEEELAFARSIADTIESKGDYLSMVPGNYITRAEEVEALAKRYKDAPVYDMILPMPEKESVMSGSTDVGDVSWVCPTAQISAVTEAAGTPGHSWQQVAQGKSTIAKKGMLFAGKVMAGAVIDLLEDPQLIEQAKQEHEKRLGGAKYQPPIPKDIRPMAINPSGK